MTLAHWRITTGREVGEDYSISKWTELVQQQSFLMAAVKLGGDLSGSEFRILKTWIPRWGSELNFLDEPP